MIKTVKTILTSVIIQERLLSEFSSVSRKKKEKTYRIKLTEDNIKLLTACYKYGIKNEKDLCQTIRQQSLSGSEPKGSTPKSKQPIETLADDQEDIPLEFADVINKHFHELL